MTFLRPHISGDAFSGTAEPCSGIAYDVNARPASWDTMELDYDYEAANATEYQVGLYLNGGLAQRLDSSLSLASLAGLTEGQHTVSMSPNLAAGSWPDRHGYYRGQRAYLVWDRSTDSDCASYNVYTSPSTLLATVTEIAVQEQTNIPIAGAGRCSSWGFHDSADPVNETLTVTFGATAGEYTWTLGALSGSGEFSTGETMLFPYGISVKFHDDPEDYTPSSTFTVAIGPRNDFLTDVRSPGTHTFLVSAIDAEGNESTSVEITPMYIMAIPDRLSISTPFTYIEPDLIIPWVDDSSGNDVYVYSNWNAATNSFEDHVIMDWPHAILSMVEGMWTFSPGDVEGTFKFYIRPTVPSNLLRQNEDLTLYTFNFPPTPTDLGIVLGEPGSLSAVALADGYIRFSWDYRLKLNDSVAEFHVVDNVGSPTFDWDNPSPVVPYAASESDVGTYSVTMGPYTNGAVVYLSVRAATVADVQSLNNVYVSAVADDTAPVFNGPGYNVPQ